MAPYLYCSRINKALLCYKLGYNWS